MFVGTHESRAEKRFRIINTKVTIISICYFGENRTGWSFSGSKVMRRGNWTTVVEYRLLKAIDSTWLSITGCDTTINNQ